MTGWTENTAAEEGHLNTNSIWAVIGSEGNGRTDVIKKVAIAPEYDNSLGFVISVDTVYGANTNYTVQFCDSTGAVLKSFSSAEGMIYDKTTEYDVRFYITGGVMNITELAKEFRVKILVNGEQHYHTLRFNFLALINHNHFNYSDSIVARYIYSLYETTLD